MILFHFYRAAYHEKAVRPSVKRDTCDKMKESCAYIFIPYERPFILVFCKEEWLAENGPIYLKFWVNRRLLERNRRYSVDIRL